MVYALKPMKKLIFSLSSIEKLWGWEVAQLTACSPRIHKAAGSIHSAIDAGKCTPVIPALKRWSRRARSSTPALAT